MLFWSSLSLKGSLNFTYLRRYSIFHLWQRKYNLSFRPRICIKDHSVFWFITEFVISVGKSWFNLNLFGLRFWEYVQFSSHSSSFSFLVFRLQVFQNIKCSPNYFIYSKVFFYIQLQFTVELFHLNVMNFSRNFTLNEGHSIRNL